MIVSLAIIDIKKIVFVKVTYKKKKKQDYLFIVSKINLFNEI